MRGGRIVTAALVLATVVGCADDGDGASPPTTPAGQAEEDDATASLDLPTEPIGGEAVVVVGDEVWIVGGVSGYRPYEAHPQVVRRSTDGSILGTIPLDLPAGEVLQTTSRPVVVDGVPHLAGQRCELFPQAENGPCGEGEPVLHRVEAGGLVALDAPAGWGTRPDDPTVWFGRPPWLVGTVGDRIVTTASLGDGPIHGATDIVEVVLVDPVTGTATVVPTVPGVVTFTSVCADGERIWSLAPSIDADRKVTGADLWVQDDPIGAPDAPPRHVTTITLDGPRGITSGALTCADGFVVITGSTGGGAFAVVDTGSGQQVGGITGWDDWGAHLRVPPGGDGRRMVISRVPDNGSTEPRTHQLVTREGVTDLPDGDVARWSPGTFPSLAVVEVDGRLLDISRWLEEPDVEQPAIELT